MADLNAQDEITVDAVRNVLVDAGYEAATGEDESCFFLKDPESGLSFTCVLENNILFNTVACIEMNASAITVELMHKLLDSGNGISTSGFQLYKASSGKTIVTLNNFCKLQDLGEEDRDDMLSCLEFLNVDVLAASELFADYL